MLSHGAGSDPEAVMSVYEASGVPKWAIRQCLEGDDTTGYILNNQNLNSCRSKSCPFRVFGVSQ